MGGENTSGDISKNTDKDKRKVNKRKTTHCLELAAAILDVLE